MLKKNLKSLFLFSILIAVLTFTACKNNTYHDASGINTSESAVQKESFCASRPAVAEEEPTDEVQPEDSNPTATGQAGTEEQTVAGQVTTTKQTTASEQTTAAKQTTTVKQTTASKQTTTKQTTAGKTTEAPETAVSPSKNPERDSSFKIVGYYPYWSPGKTYTLQYDILTHVIYAFAIPTEEGTLRPLENPSLALSIIRDAHAKGCKVLLSVGGWSYNNVPLESTFAKATSTPEKRKRLIQAIIDMCDTYGFDGIDIDWEYPRAGKTDTQYEEFMTELSKELHSRQKLLTAAVVNGMSAEGYIYSNAAAQTDAVLKCVDWINVMAYDGGDGTDSAPYETAIAGADYWNKKRNVPAEKIVLGVPFFGITDYNSSVNLLKKKTLYAYKKLGGLMIWEISKDYQDHKTALLNVINDTINSLK